MSSSAKCPLCGGSLDLDRDVERLVREGENVALVRVRADVCGDCAEVLLHPGMADRIVEAKATLRHGVPSGTPVLGRVCDLRTPA